MIVILYGINGVGKDTIAEELSLPNKVIVSRSRLLMYHLGLADGFTSDVRTEKGAYQALERIPEERVQKIRNTDCRKSVVRISAKGKLVLYLSHLVVVKHLGKGVRYVTPEISRWVKKEADKFAFIKAPPRNILIWRREDERRRPTELEQITKHQKKSLQRYQELMREVSKPFTIIDNRTGGLQNAVSSLEEFIKEE